MLTNSLTTFLPDEPATLAFAGEVAQAAGESAVIFLHGQLGAGKTTFSRGFLRSLGYKGAVKSPTYALVEPYDLGDFHVFHFDFYRLQDPHELEYIGIRDYFAQKAICLIEWPDLGGEFLPQPDLSCYIELRDQGRELRIEATSMRGEEMLKQLKKQK
jgi:tRNA threonylcarbamoyladenosine biosynthesis protein TsaE